MAQIEIIAQTLTWISVSTYLAAALAQAWANYKLKSTDGLSHLFVLLYFNTYVFCIAYIFCLDLPAPYKLLEPISFMLVGTIVLQYIWYHEEKTNQKMKKLLKLNSFFAALFYVFAFINPLFIGHIAGWLTFFCDTFCQLPQAIKMHRARSVKGFSFLYASFIAIANTSELIGAIILRLPIQTVFMGIKALIIYAFFIYTFIQYKHESDQAIEESK